ncbi:ferritin family protein [Mesoaciditoga lauensis]|uniref:ferritin family protein n=1 Tax=Mesoaciditoga lauensis TaxID=1495039 RepID=UPI000B0A098E|nr:ferritin family protein [Mesoaciditoga lauensis]
MDIATFLQEKNLIAMNHMNKGVLGILKFALSREIEGMNFYREKVKDVKDREVKEVLEQLSEMETGHVDYIKKLIENVENGNPISEVKAPEQDVSFFNDREKKELTTGKIDDIASELSILRMAYLIEDDFMHFYDNSAEKVEDEDAKKILKALASWEKEHRDMLYSMYEERSKEYWDEMGFTPLF